MFKPKCSSVFQTIIFCLLSLSILVACGGRPLAQPNEPTAQPLATTTVAIEPTPVSLDTPVLPYTFASPEILQSLEGDNNFKVDKGLTNSAEEVFVMGDTFVALINVEKDLKRPVFQWSDATYRNFIPPIEVKNQNLIALILYNLQTEQYELWLNNNQHQPNQPALTNINPFFIPFDYQANLGVYNVEQQTFVTPSLEDTNLSVTQLPFNSVAITTTTTLYYLNQGSNSLVYYNKTNLSVINLQTHTTISPPLVDENGEPLIVRTWNIHRQVQMSDNEQKVAMVLTTETMPITFSDLYIYNVTTNTLQKINTPFSRFIDSVSWSPDNQHILVSASIGEATYKATNGETFISDKSALFLIDTLTETFWPVSIQPADEASVIGGTLWLPERKYLIVRYRFYEGEAVTYRVPFTENVE